MSINLPTVSLGPDVAQFEGNSGTSNFVFPITLSQAPLSAVTVVYSTQNGTADSSDYVPTSGTLTFLPNGALTQNVTVQVLGDLTPELNETFQVVLSNLSGGVAGRAAATGTILNDDVHLTINDASLIEGDSGTRDAVFTVTAIGDVNQRTTVNYATQDGTAMAGSDYLPRSGVLSFSLGVNTRTVTVPVVGDTLHELTEYFLVNLSNPVNALLDRTSGAGTVIDTDPLPELYVNDVQITTSGPAALFAVFTVAFDRPSGTIATVQYTTTDGTAHAGFDYTALSGVLTFAPGVTTVQVSVPVLTPAIYTPNETFYLDLFNPTGALLGDPRGAATFVYSTPPFNNQIIDDGDAGYSQSGGWTNVTNLLAYGLDYDYHAAGNGSDTATWEFDNLPAGSYQVFTKWIGFSNRATNCALHDSRRLEPAGHGARQPASDARR